LYGVIGLYREDGLRHVSFVRVIPWLYALVGRSKYWSYVLPTEGTTSVLRLLHRILGVCPHGTCDEVDIMVVPTLRSLIHPFVPSTFPFFKGDRGSVERIVLD
jgi:hypothetical protein